MTIKLDGTNGITSTDGTASAPSVTGSTSTNTGFSYGTNTVTVSTAGSARATFDASGNVGIGTTTPQSKFDVSSSSRWRLDVSTSTAIGYATNSTVTGYADWRLDSLSHQFYTNGSEKMRLDTSGNLGIGSVTYSTSPTYDQIAATRPFNVVGSSTSTTIAGSTAALTIANSDTTTNNTAQINFAAVTGANANLFSSATINCIFGARTNGQYPTGQLVFSTSTSLNSAPTEKMRIDSSGNVGIGVTAPLQRFTAVNTSITGGGPASSGSAADPNATSRFQYGSVVTDFGAYAAGQVWMQNRSFANYATNYDLVLNPNGGNVQVGGTTITNTAGYVNSRTNARVWVNFNGTTGAIRTSYNVSSVTRNGTGDYSVSFTTALADANYSASCSSSYPQWPLNPSTNSSTDGGTGAYATTGIHLICTRYGNGTVDPIVCTLQIIGN